MIIADNKKRWKILDKMLGGNKPVSSEDIFREWKNNGIEPKSFSEYGTIRSQYTLTLRQDLYKFRRIYDESGLEGPLFIETASSDDARKKMYCYSRGGWSIMPLIYSSFTRSEWAALDSAMNRLKKDVPQIMAEQIDFLVMSRLNILRGKERTVDWPEVNNRAVFDMLPVLYEAILEKKTVRIEFALFGKPADRFVLHPYILKEYRGRWYCLGYRDDKNELWPIAIDRIIIGSIKYDDTPFKKYSYNGDSTPESYFNNIIGVTKEYNESTAKDFMVEKNEYEVRLGLKSFKAWMYLITNPIHQSQIIVEPFDSNVGYGAVTIKVIPNIEMYQTILSLGQDVCLESPDFAKKKMKAFIGDIAKLYENN